MSYRQLDITPFCNCKLLYDNVDENDKEIGLDGIYFDAHTFRNKFKINKKTKIFALSDSENDNVSCGGERILIREKVKSIHILGFFYWGESGEHIQVKYADGYTEFIYVIFGDWAHPTFHAANRFDKSIERLPSVGFEMYTIGKTSHKAYLFHSDCRLTHSGIVQEIILPQNMFMHIFSITTEIKD